jgi:hypothetical protein
MVEPVCYRLSGFGRNPGHGARFKLTLISSSRQEKPWFDLFDDGHPTNVQRGSYVRQIFL